jgi:hypothetical protein
MYLQLSEKLAILAQEAGLITYLVEDAGTFIYMLFLIISIYVYKNMHIHMIYVYVYEYVCFSTRGWTYYISGGGCR